MTPPYKKRASTVKYRTEYQLGKGGQTPVSACFLPKPRARVHLPVSALSIAIQKIRSLSASEVVAFALVW
jgi:hypothetical protein